MRKFLPALACLILRAGFGYAAPIHATVAWSETPLTAPGALLNSFRSLAVADFDGDGRADVVAVSQEPTKIVWYRNTGDGGFSAQNVIATSPNGPTTVAAADFDRDGRIDVVCTTQYNAAGSLFEPRLTWFRNVGGSFTAYFAAGATVISAISTEGAVAAASLDADDFPEIVTTSYDPLNASASSRVGWYRNRGAQAPPGGDRFLPEQTIPISITQPTHVRVADLDGDGFQDLVVAFRGGGGRLAWYKGGVDGNGTPVFTEYPFATNLLNPRATTVADVDGDGFLDILSAAANFAGQPYLKWFRQTPGPNATRFTNTASEVISNYNSSALANAAYGIAAADLNADGKADAIGVSFNDDSVRWFENAGQPNYFGWNSGSPSANALKAITATANGAYSVEAADFNQDGAMDVVAGSFEDGKVAVHFNQGGQCALATANTAPPSVVEWRMDDLLRIIATNRGIAGDNHARLFSVALELETSAGVPMTTGQANLLIDRVEIYRDANGSNAFEVAADTLLGSVSDLVLAGGVLTVPIAPANPVHAQIGPGASGTFFVVARVAGMAASQSPNTIRMTHRSKGSGRSVLQDATTGVPLTVELAGNTIVSSGVVIAQGAPPPHTFTDYSFIYFGDSAAPGAGPLNDFDLDGSSNLLEFGSGIDPAVSSPASMKVSGTGPGATITQRGLPTIVRVNPGSGVEFAALFCRRKDALSGLTYTVQFASDLSGSTGWENNTTSPSTVIADDGVVQAVSVPFPTLLANLKKPRFFRVVVTAQ